MSERTLQKKYISGKISLPELHINLRKIMQARHNRKMKDIF